MNSGGFSRRVDSVKERAHGHWPDILLHLGLDEKMIVRKANMPCPMCGGTDRFQFTDKFGDGNYHCRGCGAGGGFKLAQAAKGMDFMSVLQAVERYLGLEATAPSGAADPSPLRMKKLAQRLWDEARPVTADDEVGRYLASRGMELEQYPSTLRFHPALGYYAKDGTGKPRIMGEYPAMLAYIQAADGSLASLHRTYLQGARKLAVPDAKKILSSGIHGAAVRLWPCGEELAITEGIEKSIAVHLAIRKPVWAALSAGNLEKLWMPEAVRRVSIYADNDGNFAGQACAYALARRLKAEGKKREVRVFIPHEPGVDWSDIWLRRWQAGRRQAA